MLQEDTKKLLSECDAGIQMAVSTIEGVLPAVENAHLRRELNQCKRTHEFLRDKTQQLLQKYQGQGKAPSAMARSMSWMKTNVKLALQPGDQCVADLMIDGCNMGIKSLHKYSNRYPEAAAEAQDLVSTLIQTEARLTKNLESYL